MSVIALSSCEQDQYEQYDEKALIVAGEYDAQIVNGAYYFDATVTIDGGDNILIDALFDDYDFEVISADLDGRGDGRIDIDIHTQSIYTGAEIWGDGIYDNGYLELDYKIDWGYETVHYKLTAEKY